jgi:hypothetical protein
MEGDRMMTDMMKSLRETLPSTGDVLQQIGLEKVRPPTSGLTAFATFAIGAVAGAALAVLFAPRAGRAMRQALREHLAASRERAVAPTNGGGGELAHASETASHWPEGMAPPA